MCRGLWMLRTEDVVISNLLYNEDYARIVIPNTNLTYFSDKIDRLVVDHICNFFATNGKLPTKKILAIELSKVQSLSESEFTSLGDYLQNIEKPEEVEHDWILKETEEFYKKRAIYNAIEESITIMDGTSKKYKEDAIPNLLSEALSVSFDKSIGHDYIEDLDARFDFYHRKEEKVEFDLDIFNKITRGGFAKKTLNVAMAATGVGKSLFMCHMSTAAIKLGYNVLYITMEMAEEKIAERLDMNLMDLTFDDLYAIDKKMFVSKFKNVTGDSVGKMVIKQYPTKGAHAGHFRALLKELKLKKKFTPDIVFVDYLNICCSQHVKSGAVNSYTEVKSIAEELRGLAIEFNVPIVSATQTNKEGFNNTDIDITNTSESMGLTHTVDFMCALISTEDLEKMNQLMVKQLKNRYNDLNYYKKFIIGLERKKMRLFNMEDSAQDGISESGHKSSGISLITKPKSSVTDLPFAVDEDDLPVFDRNSQKQPKGFSFTATSDDDFPI